MLSDNTLRAILTGATFIADDNTILRSWKESEQYKYKDKNLNLVSNSKTRFNAAKQMLEHPALVAARKILKPKIDLLSRSSNKNKYFNLHPKGNSEYVTPNVAYHKDDKHKICYFKSSDPEEDAKRLKLMTEVAVILDRVSEEEDIDSSDAGSTDSDAPISQTPVPSQNARSPKSPDSDALVSQSSSPPRNTRAPVAPKVPVVVSERAKKETIPMAIRRKVFDRYNGRVVEGRCYCCNARITRDSFSCGHVLAEKHGGEIDYHNLRPICKTCNSSMGTMLLHEFIEEQGYAQPVDLEELPYVLLAKAMKLLELATKDKVESLGKPQKAEHSKLTNPKKDPRVRLEAYSKLLGVPSKK